MKQELFNLRFQHVTGQLENPVKMREVKRDIARVKTIIREKELEQAQKLNGKEDDYGSGKKQKKDKSRYRYPAIRWIRQSLSLLRRLRKTFPLR